MPEGQRGRARRDFGSIRQVASGRWQARYTAPDGTNRKGPGTFATRKDADAFLAQMQSQQVALTWRDPTAPSPTVEEFFPVFQSSRMGRGGGTIRATTRALADDQFRRFICPDLGEVRLDRLTPSRVTAWYAALPDRPATRRQVYSLLKAMLELALRDDLLPSGRNPCRIPRAGQNPPGERPAFSFSEVEAVIAQMPVPLDTLALVAFGSHLRIGEVLALRWSSVDLGTGDVVVERAVSEVNNEQIETSTKTARVRKVRLPAFAFAQLQAYAITQRRDPDGRLFTRLDGSPLRHFHVQSMWKFARLRAGVPTLRFHDLRHVGLTMMAEAGMTLRTVMYRAGHSTVDAAMVYQHRAESRAAEEAAAFQRQMERARSARA